MALPSKGKGSDRGLGSSSRKKPAPQPTKRASMKGAAIKSKDAAPKRMGRRGG